MLIFTQYIEFDEIEGRSSFKNLYSIMPHFVILCIEV